MAGEDGGQLRLAAGPNRSYFNSSFAYAEGGLRLRLLPRDRFTPYAVLGAGRQGARGGQHLAQRHGHHGGQHVQARHQVAVFEVGAGRGLRKGAQAGRVVGRRPHLAAERGGRPAQRLGAGTPNSRPAALRPTK